LEVVGGDADLDGLGQAHSQTREPEPLPQEVPPWVPTPAPVPKRWAVGVTVADLVDLHRMQ